MCHFEDVKHLSPETIDPTWLGGERPETTTAPIGAVSDADKRPGFGPVSPGDRGRTSEAARSPEIAEWLGQHRIDVTRASLDDIIGVEAPKRELKSLIGRLRDPERIARQGAVVPRGVLLHGPAGCGKTTFARVLAAEAGRPFYEVSASELLNADRIRALALHLASIDEPTVVFVDEIDVIGRDRNAHKQTDEGRVALLALLAALDGVRSGGQAVWVAATNAARNELDSALLRPGRMGIHIHLQHPRLADRVRLIEHLVATRTLDVTDGEIRVRWLAGLTKGHSQAAIISYFDDAAGLAALDGRDAARESDIIEALRRMGSVEDERKVRSHERWSLAIHEAGHTAAILELLGPGELVGVQLGTDSALTVAGATEDDDDTNDADHETQAKAGPLARLAVLVAGLVAEKMIVGRALMGSGSDLDKATGLAIQVLNAGLDPDWGVQSVGRWSSWNFENGHAFGDRADATVRRLLAEAVRKAEQIVERQREPIFRFAQRLNAATELADDDLRVALRESGLCPAGSPRPTRRPGRSK